MSTPAHNDTTTDHDLGTTEGRLAAMRAAVKSARQIGALETTRKCDNKAAPIRLILDQRFGRDEGYGHLYDWTRLLASLIDRLERTGHVDPHTYRNAIRTHYGVTDPEQLSRKKHAERQAEAITDSGLTRSVWLKDYQPVTDDELAQFLLDFHDPWAELPPDLGNPVVWLETAFRRSVRLGMRAFTFNVGVPLLSEYTDAEREDWIDHQVVDLLVQDFALWLQVPQTQPSWNEVTVGHTELPLDSIPTLIQQMLAAGPLADIDLATEPGTDVQIPIAWFVEPGASLRISTLGVQVLFASKKLRPYADADTDTARIIDEEKENVRNPPDDVPDCYRYRSYLTPDIWEHVLATLDGTRDLPAETQRAARILHSRSAYEGS